MRMKNKLGAALLAAVLLGAGAVPAKAQKSADTLRIVLRDALTNIDPYYNHLRTGVVMHHRLGLTGLSQSRYVQARAAARHRVEARRIRPRSSSRCARASNSTTAAVHRRRRRLHHQPDSRSGEPALDAGN